jgi:hypothetical protein
MKYTYYNEKNIAFYFYSPDVIAKKMDTRLILINQKKDKQYLIESKNEIIDKIDKSLNNGSTYENLNNLFKDIYGKDSDSVFSYFIIEGVIE